MILVPALSARADQGRVMDEVATMSRVIELTGNVVDKISPDQLDNPTSCEAWTVRDVINHVTTGAEVFGLCVGEGAASEDQLAELFTTDRLGDDYQASFHRATDAALAAFSVPGAMDRIVTLPFGEMPARAAVDIAIFDVTTHAWDLAKATGQSTDLDPEVAAEALRAARTFLSDDLRATGRFGPAVPINDDAPVADQLAAFTGRTP
jgi:uncharacterized protein (TIGR03086 family)